MGPGSLSSFFSGPGGRFRVAVVAGVSLLVLGGAGWLAYHLWGSGADAESPEACLQRIEKIETPKSESQVQELREYARHVDVRVSVSAVRKLGEAKTQASRQALVELMRDSPQPQVRGEAAAALGKDPAADSKLLVQVLQTDKDAEARAGAAKGLARLKDQMTVPVLYEKLRDPDQKVRIWAATALSNITGARFDYRAEVPPDQQKDKIDYIGVLLRRWGMLKT
jgi:HEAT repeat protein